MKTLTLLLVFLAGVSSVSAQTMLLKNGTTVSAAGVTRNDTMLMVSVKTSGRGTGQVGYQVGDVAQLNLPAPPELATATDLLSQGKPNEALAAIDPVVTYQKGLRDIPGNWWAKAALEEVAALMALNRTNDAVALVTDISNYSKDPEILNAAKLQIATATKFNDPADAISTYNAVIAQTSDAHTLSQAWIAEGDVYFSQHEFADALMAYLAVTVLYPDKNPLLPKALWGAGQSYTRLKDIGNASKTFQLLTSNYPATPEAALAAAQLKKDQNQ